MATTRKFPRVKAVRAYTKDSTGVQLTYGADCHDVVDHHWIDGHPTPITNPMSGHPLYTASRKSWGINALGSLIVEVEAEDGTTGVGVTIGGEPGMRKLSIVIIIFVTFFTTILVSILI